MPCRSLSLSSFAAALQLPPGNSRFAGLLLDSEVIQRVEIAESPVNRAFRGVRPSATHGRCPASPLLRPHPTTAFAFANCSSPKFPCRTFGKCRPLCPAAPPSPKSSRQGGVGFTHTETLTTRKDLTRLYVGSSLALRPIPLSGKTPAHRSPFARLARPFGLSPRFARPSLRSADMS